jgi:hypothetical protein
MDEGFETSDSSNIPAGWSVWNNASFPIDPTSNWLVRTVGSCMPGISCTGRQARAHTGTKSIMATWYAGIDTATSTSGVSDAWLVTKRIRNVPSDALMQYYAIGGSSGYLDSMQVWVSTVDSMPTHFNHYVETVAWPPSGSNGTFTDYYVDLSPYAGQTVWVGFRYYTNCTVDGFLVSIDDVKITGTVGINQLGLNVPDKFTLSQNYPNPFNPVTKIKFDLAKNTHLKLTVFNALGQVVEVLVDGYKNAGFYEADFNGSNYSSGTYFYRLETDYFTETKKMLLVK